jgi:hypothetical protein
MNLRNFIRKIFEVFQVHDSFYINLTFEEEGQSDWVQLGTVCAAD